MEDNKSILTIVLVTTEYVTEDFFDGGLSNYVHRAALGLKKLGHKPIVFVLSHENEDVFIHKGIEVHRFRVYTGIFFEIFNSRKYNDSLFRFWNWITFGKLYHSTIQVLMSWQLREKLKQIEHPISLVQYPNCAALGLFHLKNVPKVTRISGYLPQWNDAYGLKRTLDIWLMEKQEDLANKLSDALFCPSKLNAITIEKIVRKNVEVIETPFIIETESLNYSIYKEYLEGKQYLLFFGTIGIMKGCGLIAEIIYSLLAFKENLFFVFVGKDKDYMGFQGKSTMDKIRENAGENKDRVIHFDRLTHDYLYPIVANANAVVLPSRIDNFPNTCIEAMGHKRIVIGTNGTSFEQLIEDGVSGFLCENDNSQDLLRVIKEVLNLTEKKRLEIGEKAYQRIQDLQPEKVINQLVDFYRQTIDDFHSKY
ncbi:glycosyltransferase [Geminocystis sp. NIES-3708]|nr:glycosyltransferase [Geminocystis sp. NIES-3708]